MSCELDRIIDLPQGDRPDYVVSLIDALKSIDWGYRNGWLTKGNATKLIENVIANRKISTRTLLDTGTLTSDLVLLLVRYCGICCLAQEGQGLSGSISSTRDPNCIKPNP